MAVTPTPEPADSETSVDGSSETDILTLYSIFYDLKSAEDALRGESSPAALDRRNGVLLHLKKTVKQHIDHRRKKLIHSTNILYLRSAQLRRFHDLVQILVIISSTVIIAFESLKDTLGGWGLSATLPVALSLFNSVALSILRYWNIQAQLDCYQALLNESEGLSAALNEFRETLPRRGTVTELETLYGDVEAVNKKVQSWSSRFMSAVKVTDAVTLGRKYGRLRRQLRSSA